MKLPSKKVMIITLLAATLIGIGYMFGAGDYFSLERLQQHHHFFKEFVASHYLASVGIYLAVFTMAMACGLPIVMPLALIGGFLYGLFLGVLFACVSCVAGSVISFLVLRYVVVNWIEHWHNERIERFNHRLQKYGYSYLLILHFLSVIPMAVINLLAAIANVPLATVAGITLVGTLPFNILCVVAGRQLSTVRSIKDLFSPTILILLSILIVFACIPLFVKKIKGYLGV